MQGKGQAVDTGSGHASLVGDVRWCHGPAFRQQFDQSSRLVEDPHRLFAHESFTSPSAALVACAACRSRVLLRRSLEPRICPRKPLIEMLATSSCRWLNTG